MPDYSLFNVAIQAKGLRDAQKLYFKLIGKARATKKPEDFAAAKKVLNISKDLEVSFDETIEDILNEK